MKRTGCLIITFVMVCFMLTACYYDGITEPTDRTSDIPADHAYLNDYSYTLPRQIEVGSIDNDTLGRGDKVYQSVLAFGREIVTTALYEYDSFYALDGKLSANSDPVWFREDRALYVNCSDAAPLDKYVPVTYPGVFGCFEEKVLSLDFSGAAPESYRYGVRFLLKTKDGQETFYTVLTDGTVKRGNDEYSAEKLTEDVVLYFFAARYNYYYASLDSYAYVSGMNVRDLDVFDNSQVAVIEKNGERIVLDDEKTCEFLAKLSNHTPENSPDGAYSYDYTFRSNCGSGDHGEKLFDFGVTNYSKTDGLSNIGTTYSLYSDGSVVMKLPHKADMDPGRADIWGDVLYCDIYIISSTAFDTADILAFVGAQTSVDR